jgi:hypothetical protein
MVVMEKRLLSLPGKQGNLEFYLRLREGIPHVIAKSEAMWQSHENKGMMKVCSVRHILPT